jgi:hypothetical protein
MKKIRGDPFGVIIYTDMAISQGNSLCSYLYLKKDKMPCFVFKNLNKIIATEIFLGC